LVFEYVSNGTLQDKLHGAGREIRESSRSTVLSWRKRMAIAYQLAQALEYLHEKCPLQIVHGDIKPSNILLDEQLNCKLCDFGFAKMGFSSTVMSSNNRKQVMMGSPGYTDPHYLRTGIASKKNDVYSYGVIILELVTGMEAFCEERGQGQLLTSMIGPILKSIIASGD
jgi:serine/threonine protein kinase